MSVHLMTASELAAIFDVTPRRVIVDGFGRRGPDTMMFANVRGCPLIGR